ncbi:MAG: hypothetical protein ABIQ90_10805 [Polaromonas sp.]
MKRLFVFAVVSASLVGCATAPPADPNHPVNSQAANGVPVDQTYRAPRASVGIGFGNWGGRGFGGVGIGLGF